jgi:hypothetical protein
LIPAEGGGAVCAVRPRESRSFLSAAPARSPAAAFGPIAETLAVALAGGALLGLSGMPAGWLSGSILAVAGASLANRPMLIPTWLMRTIFVIVGISLGAVVTPETLNGVAAYPLSIVVLIVAMAFVAVAGAYYLQIVHGWDKVSAYLAAAPGGMSQVIVLAAEVGADIRAVAIVQTMRVVIVAVGLPACLALFGLVNTTVRRSIGGPFELSQLGELAILIAASGAMAVAAHRVRFPGGLLFGAMLTSVALHGTGTVHAVMPWWAVIAAQVALGAVTGSRFAGTPLKLLLQFVAAAFGSFAVSVAIAAVFAVGLINLVPVPLAEVMIAFAPGSVDAMMLLALALNLDPVYVGAHHLTRILLVSVAMPLFARRSVRAQEVFVDEEKPPLVQPQIEE